jgi:hypothetical protein
MGCIAKSRFIGNGEEDVRAGRGECRMAANECGEHQGHENFPEHIAVRFHGREFIPHSNCA